MQACSALVHKFEANVCSFFNSTETEPPTQTHSDDNNEVKEEEEQKNETIVSSDISTTNKEHIETTMGNKTSKIKGKTGDFTELTDSQIEMLVSSTNFSPQQIREWHQSFIRDCPTGLSDYFQQLRIMNIFSIGKLDRKRFIEVYQQFYPQGKASNFCSLAFKAFDRDKNGIVDFNEFLTAIALTMSSEPKDRLDLAFSMYDINGDGLLDKKDLTQIIKLIYEVNGKRNLKQDLPPQDKARMIIDKFDTDGDGKLSRQEFIVGCMNDYEIRKLLMP